MTGVNLKDFKSSATVGHLDFDFSVKSSRPSQGWVDGVWPVCGRNYDDLSPCFETIHQGKELRNHPPFDFTGYFLSLRADAVDFVYENNGWCLFPGFLEYFTQSCLALSLELAHGFRAWNADEVRVTFVSNCFSK